MIYENNKTISFGRLHKDTRIPTKRDEDGCYDVYAAFDDFCLIIPPHENRLVPTGLVSAFSPKWRVAVRERGSASKSNLAVKCGQIDSGYRGEWFICIRNDNDCPVEITHGVTEVTKGTTIDNQPVIYVPVCKAICQIAIEEVPTISVIEEDPSLIRQYESERGSGRLGSSGK